MTDLPQYYAERATEYERFYDKPGRQADLAALATTVSDYFEGSRLLELACGTGWWTHHAAQRASSVLGVDINDEVLTIARAKDYPRNNTRLLCADLNSLSELGESFDAALVVTHRPPSATRVFDRAIPSLDARRAGYAAGQSLRRGQFNPNLTHG